VDRCIVNILTNAYQAIEEKADNSRSGAINVFTERDEKAVKIIISDNGAGFNQKEVNRIFEPLYSTKTFGVGLGMPVTKQIIETHGWNIDMNGEPGKGATVTVSMPFSS
jgi:signal transduction histidine kinase